MVLPDAFFRRDIVTRSNTSNDHTLLQVEGSTFYLTPEVPRVFVYSLAFCDKDRLACPDCLESCIMFGCYPLYFRTSTRTSGKLE